MLRPFCFPTKRGWQSLVELKAAPNYSVANALILILSYLLIGNSYDLTADRIPT